MKLSEFKGEDAIDVLADIIEPITEIVKDDEVTKLWKTKGNNVANAAKVILKRHKHEVVEVLAAMERKTYDEYLPEVTVLSLPIKLLEVLNDKDFMDFFTQQVGTIAAGSSGDATENTDGEA